MKIETTPSEMIRFHDLTLEKVAPQYKNTIVEDETADYYHISAFLQKKWRSESQLDSYDYLSYAAKAAAVYPSIRADVENKRGEILNRYWGELKEFWKTWPCRWWQAASLKKLFPDVYSHIAQNEEVADVAEAELKGAYNDPEDPYDQDLLAIAGYIRLLIPDYSFNYQPSVSPYLRDNYHILVWAHHMISQAAKGRVYSEEKFHRLPREYYASEAIWTSFKEDLHKTRTNGYVENYIDSVYNAAIVQATELIITPNNFKIILPEGFIASSSSKGQTPLPVLKNF